MLANKITTRTFDTCKNNLENPNGSELPNQCSLSFSWKLKCIYYENKQKKTWQIIWTVMPSRQNSSSSLSHLKVFSPQMLDWLTLYNPLKLQSVSELCQVFWTGILHCWPEQEGESHLQTSSHCLFHSFMKCVAVPVHLSLSCLNIQARYIRKGHRVDFHLRGFFCCCC